jgi:LCP family protein required for cell wall assembly
MDDSMQSTQPMPRVQPVQPRFHPLQTQKPTKRNWWSQHGWKWLWRVTLVIVVLIIVAIGLLLHRIYDFGMAISSQSPFSSQLDTSGRVSMVFFGYGGAGYNGEYLTDSILVITYDYATGKSAFISVPRDLWVQVPSGSGHYAKLNSTYSYGMYHGGKETAGAMATQKISEILGISVPYWASLDFTGFQEMVDKLGGVDINVPDTFSVSLKIGGKPETTFQQGMEHMNGSRALLFARARYCLPLKEASDFARSARQQILLKAIATKIKTVSNWTEIPGAMDTMQSQLTTNLSIRDLITIFNQVDFGQAKHIGLTNQNVLVDETSSGQAILVPRNGDWSLIQQYVQDQLQS